MTQLFDISGKIAVVTGGATGIGAMITEGLVRAGCHVFIASRKADILEAFAAEMNEIEPNSVGWIVADLATAEGTAALVEALRQKTDHIDILVNNSGASWGATFDDFPRSGWDKVLSVNVTAIADLTRLLMPLLECRAGFDAPSRIINIGSIMGTWATPSVTNSVGAYSYTVSKGAVHHLTKLFSNELAPRHVTVNAIAPGPFPSRMMAFATDAEEKRQALAANIPLGRIGTADDVVGTVIWLCSRAGSYLTGAIIPLDGGMSASA
jgi:NAD(P)-dependent dehydrogenase (short-subunit alcohol dehydrogenase family)